MPIKYDHLATRYDNRWRSYIEATLNAVLQAVDFRGNEAVLDVPCGTGELQRRLIAKWPDLCITGVDLSPGMLAQAKAKDDAHRASWIEADVTEIPLPDESFDCVICANSFHYFHAPSEALSEMRRVLRPGGRLLLVDWCDDYWTCKACSWWLRLTDKAFYRTYSLKACASLAANAGFQVEQKRHFRIDWLWGLLLLDCHREE